MRTNLTLSFTIAFGFLGAIMLAVFSFPVVFILSGTGALSMTQEIFNDHIFFIAGLGALITVLRCLVEQARQNIFWMALAKA